MTLVFLFLLTLSQDVFLAKLVFFGQDYTEE